jgi:hypothetical protein
MIKGGYFYNGIEFIDYKRMENLCLMKESDLIFYLHSAFD